MATKTKVQTAGDRLWDALKASTGKASPLFTIEERCGEDEGIAHTGEFGVWFEDDIIGSGGSREEALEDAVVTVKNWKVG